MIKKYKNRLLYIAVSIIVLAIIGIITSKVIAAFNPSEEQFLKMKADNLIGKDVNGTSLYDLLDNKGNLACFYHREGGVNAENSKIHSVFDIDFDTNKGEMKVYSVMETTAGKTTSKTTYASDRVKNKKGNWVRNGRNIGQLAANAARQKNAYKVWETLKIAIADKAVVNESAIVGGVSAWGGNEAFGGSGNTSIRNLSNPPDDNTVASYQNYRKITKVTVKGKDGKNRQEKETGKEVTINGKSYTIVGPFKVTLGGKDITEVKAGNAKWTPTNKGEIYWKAVADIGNLKDEKNWKTGWLNDFNKKKDKNSIPYYISNKAFYMAIETDKLPDNGKYDITINQDEFKYNKSRIAVTVGSLAQQMGMYCYDSTPTTVKGSVKWSVTRNALKTLVISKKDSKTGNELSGAAFKVYAELDDGTKGWVSGSAEGTKTYGETATEYAAKVNITNLKVGTYYIYETKSPNGYDMVNQKGYHQEANGSKSLTGDWVYLGKRVLRNSDGTVTVAVTNSVSPKINIVKKDSIKKIELSGGKFKLYAVLDDGTKGWLSGAANGSKTYGDNADAYDSNTDIEQLKYGTYHIYETKTPEGYDITKQDGYHKEAEGSSSLSGDWVYLGTQKVDENGSNDGKFTFEALNSKIVSDLEGMVWIDQPATKANASDNVYKENAENQGNDTKKEGITVNLYAKGENNQDILLATTKTDANGEYKFTSKNAPSYTGADKNIYYWDLANAYVEFIYNNKTTYEDEKEETRDKVKEYGYVAVDPFIGSDATINSKAQEYKVTQDALQDDKLTGTEGTLPGRAVTNKDAKITDVNDLLKKNQEVYDAIVKNNNATEKTLKDVPLACYYNKDTYKVSNINLGLKEQFSPDYSVDENLEYIKVKMKGYTYTYKYGDDAVTNSKYVPTVNEQNSAKTFTGKIYPTDIAYNVATNTNELQVYVVYSISVKNLTAMYVDNVYREQRLYLDSLTNTYDTNRFTLCQDANSDKNGADFGLWEGTNGTARYNIEKGVYKNGISNGTYNENNEVVPNEVTSYIQFKLTDKALEKILKGNLSEEELKGAPTIATATAYHEYQRTDNAWVHEDDFNLRSYVGVNGLKTYPKVNDKNNNYYVHKSVSKKRTSAELYLKLSLGEPRKISGTVFEDTKETDEGLGNGKIDDKDTNRAQDVTVELLDSNKDVSSLYKVNSAGGIVYDENGNLPQAQIKTTVGGTYEFEGVVPGVYSVRFTYGDGSQMIIPAKEPEKISIRDYKSTIINTTDAGDIIKNAFEIKAEDLKTDDVIAPKENKKKLIEWYKYLNGTNYSTAVDDLTEIEKTNGYKYSDDGKIYDEDGNEVTNYPTTVYAYTPLTSISIENDTSEEGNVAGKEDDVTISSETYKSEFAGFNLGIIKKPTTTVKLEKKITNVKLTDQAGTTIVSANPTDKSALNITALDKVTGGSKSARMEMDQNLLYGSNLATTYEITLENRSEKDYVEKENSTEYGHYYYYGEKTETAEAKAVIVNEVVDTLDDKYKLDTPETKITGTKYETGNKENGTPIEVSITKKKPDGSTETTNTISMTEWGKLEQGESESVTYTVSSLLSSDDDLSYTNKAQITSITLDKLTTLNSQFEWGNDTTTITLSKPTGADKRPIYWVAATIGLIVIATGIVFLKKKVLKK